MNLRRGQQPEVGEGGGLLGQKVEELPLRHKGDKFAARRQAGEIRQLDVAPGDFGVQGLRTLVRQRQQFVEQAQLVHDFQRRRVNGVTAKIAQEVGVLLQHRHIDPRPRQQIAEHQPGGAASHDAAGGGVRCDW